MRALGDQVEGLEATVQEGMEDSSQELATEVVEFTLASLWSRFPPPGGRRGDAGDHLGR